MVKALVYEQSNGDSVASVPNASNISNADGINIMHVLAVTEHHLHSYSIRDCAKIWSCELADMATKHFASDLLVCAIQVYMFLMLVKKHSNTFLEFK